MSNTFDMVCKTCKEEYWFGQTSGKEVFMYKPQPFMDWLVKHREHELVVFDEYTEWPEWYEKSDIKSVSYEDFGKSDNDK